MPLSAQQRAAMNGFFTPQLLEGARLLVLQGERVANPDFYRYLWQSVIGRARLNAGMINRLRCGERP
jgi:hypothetical protein